MTETEKNASKRKKIDKVPFRQGTADGLCGLYCIINFLSYSSNFCKGEYVSHDLWHLLTVANQFGWFTPQAIHQGFEDYQLKDIFNQHCENRKLGFQAFFLCDYMKALELKYVSAAASRAFKNDKKRDRLGAVLAYLYDDDHWILVRGEGLMLKIYDSLFDEVQNYDAQMLDAKSCQFRGLVIMPKDRQLSRMFS